MSEVPETTPAEATDATNESKSAEPSETAQPSETVQASETAQASDAPVVPPTVEQSYEALKAVEDPEIKMSILDLGLIYDVEVGEDGFVTVTHSLTSPGCPVGPMIQGQIYHVLMQLPGVVDVEVNLVWDPPWDPREMASDEVKLALGVW